jgi:hypothetical protein
MEPTNKKGTNTNPRLEEEFEDARMQDLGDYGVNHPSRLEFNQNLESMRSEVNAIFKEAYNNDGTSATIANDYYKLAMAPVLRAGKKLAGKGTVAVTFALDVRDKALSERLLNNDAGIQDDVILALDALKSRKFDHAVVLAAVKGKPMESFWFQNIDKICGPSHAPHTLIRAATRWKLSR